MAVIHSLVPRAVGREPSAFRRLSAAALGLRRRCFRTAASSMGSEETQDARVETTDRAKGPGKRVKLRGRAFYESIGSPKLILAPMVEQSEFVRCPFCLR